MLRASRRAAQPAVLHVPNRAIQRDRHMPTESFIPGKDASLESSIATMQGKLEKLGFHVEERSWLNPVDGVWSVHVRDRDCPLLFTNGKGGSRLAALASALGEFFERLSCNYFWTHYYLGDQFANATSPTTRASNGSSPARMASGPSNC
jgi:ribosomal protein S12 methylthiotransferase accessory factor YcaO